ncbi:hypothetical protein VOLCADRAFT_118201 [Volvox carteri f. nagariensis]|uniref:Uncharacterized protein n=1 Tax=Volvox carteri f. nagariensis TaxID=3068 RepID=D8U2Q0_VOLCA|nr:uncharacterized protein VOLCADRAFT_118201 [Volvox carteri f. nagariensis]EFJ45845.1 hypothetical protein VOLCADRAFT_118201 [Volvox carteri f. nagariensis]|eukprot:XP_002952923.1 hypothetical protein VOLCADRAFT_118201 [Volvox carteri f. nagariensis]
MAPKGSVSKRKGAAAPSAPTPLSLYKRSLLAIRNWTPPTSARADAEALTGLAACCRLLQAQMGLTQPSPAAAGNSPLLAMITTTPITTMNPEAWAALEALEPGMASYSGVVRHSLDLDLGDWQDEPGFLLASAHLEIGRLLGRMFPRKELLEQLHLEAALKLFPDFVAAGAALGQANAACRREWEAGQGAVRSLAMLLCQAGRDEEAVPYLEAMEFTHRLARQVCVYARYVRAVDGALPLPLLKVLRSALSPNSRFWSEHGYGRVGYFSYMHELGAPCLSAIHQAAVLLHRIAVQRFPAVAEARFAECDDEGVGGVRNPIVSCVIYLTGVVGGPTLVTPQLLGGPLAPHGWLVYPAENRLGMFDSTVLHGVIPGRGPSPRPEEYRITLMVAFWRDIQCSRYTWMEDLPPHPDGPDGWGTTDPRDVVPTTIERVWERLDGSTAQPGSITSETYITVAAKVL